MNAANKAKPIISFTSIVIEMLVVAALAPLLFSSSLLLFLGSIGIVEPSSFQLSGLWAPPLSAVPLHFIDSINSITAPLVWLSLEEKKK